MGDDIMTNLNAIIRATRASAKATADCQRYARAARWGQDEMERVEAARFLRRAQARYARAQSILAANPLPGDPA